MIKFYQELVQISEAGVDFEEPEAFLSEAWKTPGKRNIAPASLRTGMSMEEDTRDKTEGERAGPTALVSSGEGPHEGRSLVIEA